MANGAGGADVAHSHTWYTGLAGTSRALSNDIPHVVTAHSLEPRPALEGRAAGWRIPDLVVVRTQRDGTCRRDHRGQRRNAGRRARHLPGDRSRPSARGAQRDRHGRLVPPARQTPAPPRYSPRTASRSSGRSRSSSDASPDRRDLPTSSPPRTGSIPRSSWCCARARPTRGTGGGDGARGRPPRRGARRSVLDPRHATHRPGARNTFRRDGFRVPVGLRAAGIVNLEAMAAPRRWSPRTSGGIPEVVQDGVTGRLVHYNSYEWRPSNTRSPTRSTRWPPMPARQRRWVVRDAPCNGPFLVGPGGAADAGGLPGRTRSPIARDHDRRGHRERFGQSGDRLGAARGADGERRAPFRRGWSTRRDATAAW